MAQQAIEEKKGNREIYIRGAIQFIAGGLVELFAGAVTNCVLGQVEGSKLGKLGAKAGGFLVGWYIGDRVSDYILDGYDHAMKTLAEVRESMEEEG